MRILVIENVSLGKKKYGFFEKTLLTTFSILPTLHARQMVALTPKKHTVDIINERYTRIDFNKPYDLININFATSTALRAFEIAETFRKKNKTVVLSGIHPSLSPKESKEHADSVIIGRGELSWANLLYDFEKGELKAFYYPCKYNDSFRIPPLNVQLPGFVVTGVIEATRGCPYKCTFCPDSHMFGGSDYYERPIPEVISEIKALPQKTIMFYDASLTINPVYTKNLFKRMIGLHKKFFCNGNINVLAQDKELVELSKRAGCVSWLIGFESINQKTLDQMNKRTNIVEDYFQAVQNIHKCGMAVVGCFMFGFDTDNVETFSNTLDMVKSLKIDVADFSILTPFPGTPIFEKLETEGRILTRDWSRYTGKNVVFQPKHMTPEGLYNGVKDMYHDFYSNYYTLKRIINGLSLGFYPFFLILVRNAISHMNYRLLLSSR